MKWALRGIAALLALAAFALGFLLFSLPRLAESEAAQRRIQEATREVLGAELRYARLDFGLLPPSLVVSAPALWESGAVAEPLARADRVAMRVQLWPLLRRRLEVQSLVVDGLAVRAVRDAGGLALPGRAPRAGAPGAGVPAPDRPEGGSATPPREPTGIVLGIHTIALRDASLAVEDRSVSPPRTSTFSGIDAGLRARGEGDARRLAGELRVADSDAAISGLHLRGPLRALLDAPGASPLDGARFEVDAGEAELRYGADFVKPPGTRAEVRGVLARGERGALGVDELEIALHDLVATGSLRSGADPALALRADPVSLEGWEALLPPLALLAPRGRVGVPELRLGGDLRSARARFDLDEVVVQPPERAPLSFTGELALADAALTSREARLVAAGQPFSVRPRIEGLGAAPRVEIAFAGEGVDSDALLGGFAGLPDRLYGPLTARGTLSTPLGGGKPLRETLSGEVAFDIEGGRIVGASLLEAALGSLGARLAATTRERGAERWQRFYSEDFELVSGRLRVGGGRVVTEPVTLRYRDYGLRLEGPIRLADLALDLRGTLSIGPALDAELARAFGASEDYVAEARELAIESVRGTPEEPKVQLAGSSVANLAAHYVKQTRREDLKRKIEEKVGPGSGEIVDRGLDALEGLLGGREGR